MNIQKRLFHLSYRTAPTLVFFLLHRLHLLLSFLCWFLLCFSDLLKLPYLRGQNLKYSSFLFIFNSWVFSLSAFQLHLLVVHLLPTKSFFLFWISCPNLTHVNCLQTPPLEYLVSTNMSRTELLISCPKSTPSYEGRLGRIL